MIGETEWIGRFCESQGGGYLWSLWQCGCRLSSPVFASSMLTVAHDARNQLTYRPYVVWAYGWVTGRRRYCFSFHPLTRLCTLPTTTTDQTHASVRRAPDGVATPSVVTLATAELSLWLVGAPKTTITTCSCLVSCCTSVLLVVL